MEAGAPPGAEIFPPIGPARVVSETGQLDRPALGQGPLHHAQEAARVLGLGGVARRQHDGRGSCGVDDALEHLQVQNFVHGLLDPFLAGVCARYQRGGRFGPARRTRRAVVAAVIVVSRPTRSWLPRLVNPLENVGFVADGFRLLDYWGIIGPDKDPFCCRTASFQHEGEIVKGQTLPADSTRNPA